MQVTCIMQLRECLWRKLLRLPDAPLPRVAKRFCKSTTWAQQTDVLDHDIRRMPCLHKENVRKIVMRHAATMPNHGYCQGNLYLIYVLGRVFRDEQSIFWAYQRMCQRIHCFSPESYQPDVLLPTWLLHQAQALSNIPVDTWDLLLPALAIHHVWANRRVSPMPVRCVGLPHSSKQAHAVHVFCAVEYAAATLTWDDVCVLEKARYLIAVQVKSIQDTAALIARAHEIEEKRYIAES